MSKPWDFKLVHVVDAQQFDEHKLDTIFKIADEMKSEGCSRWLSGKRMTSLFYEPSTRTRLSFEAAMLALGGQVMGTENAKTFSSKAKGESLEDSIKVISGYCDVIVLRYYKKGGAKRAREHSLVPIINAGDGTGQHPTQALLDLYTIRQYFKKSRELKVAMVGDLKNGRTVHSLAYLLPKYYPRCHVYFVSPKQVIMKVGVKKYLTKHGIEWEESDRLDAILPEVDVIYQTRVQTERFEKNKKSLTLVQNAAERLIINEGTLKKMKKDAIIMHPLPRNQEIAYEVDKDPRAKYFEQAQNGFYIRMALLRIILGEY